MHTRPKRFVFGIVLISAFVFTGMMFGLFEELRGEGPSPATKFLGWIGIAIVVIGCLEPLPVRGTMFQLVGAGFLAASVICRGWDEFPQSLVESILFWVILVVWLLLLALSWSLRPTAEDSELVCRNCGSDELVPFDESAIDSKPLWKCAVCEFEMEQRRAPWVYYIFALTVLVVVGGCVALIANQEHWESLHIVIFVLFGLRDIYKKLRPMPAVSIEFTAPQSSETKQAKFGSLKEA